MGKPKVALYWNASCGGCEEAWVDLAEDILKVAKAVDIVLWPVAMDFKRKDVEALKDGEIVATFLNGGVRTSEQEDWAKLLRRKSRLVVAFGSCAHLGGAPGLANLHDRTSIFDAAYGYLPTVDNPAGVRPQHQDARRRASSSSRRSTTPCSRSTRSLTWTTTFPAARLRRTSSWRPSTALLAGKLPAKGIGARAGEVALRHVQAQRDEAGQDQARGDQASAPDVHGSGEVLPRRGRHLHGARDARRVRRALHQREHAVPGVLRAHGRGAGTRARSSSPRSPRSSTSTIRRRWRRLSDSIPDPIGVAYMYGLPASILTRRKMRK